MNSIYHTDNMEALFQIKDNTIDLIYIDPPFNTGKTQTRNGKYKYEDNSGHEEYIFKLRARMEVSVAVLKPSGSIFVHLDNREVHYVKVMMDKVFGRNCFMNEIIWAYDYGGRSKRKWSSKHDTILWYVRDPGNYTFNYDEMDRIPYMAPSP